MHRSPQTLEACEANYRAEQVPGAVIVFATGSHPTAGYRVLFEQTPLAVFPPELALWHVRPTGIVLQVISPFSEHLTFPAHERVRSVVVHDATGRHEVPVEQVPDMNLSVAGTAQSSSWAAWHDRMPGTPATLHVHGEVTFPTTGYAVELRRAVPQGINPTILILDKLVRPPTGPVQQVMTTVVVRYREVTNDRFTEVRIEPDGISVPVKEVS